MVSTPTTTVANGKHTNGDLPNIKPLKVNGEQTSPVVEEKSAEEVMNGKKEDTDETKAKTEKTEEEAQHEIVNGNHKPLEEKSEPVST